MKKLIFGIIQILIYSTYYVNAVVNWNGNNWAIKCDFPSSGDFNKVETTGAKCGDECASNPACTHFTWAHGTCYLKKGRISKSDAFNNNDPLTTCGVKTNSDNNIDESIKISGHNWMSKSLSKIGKYKIRNLCMPGSHDAGMNKNVDGTIATDCSVVTQRKGIYDQLMNGVRFFDIRIIIGNGEYHTGHYSKSGLGWLGGRGQSISEIIDQINSFTKTNKEFIILYVSRDLNTDKNYRSFNKDEWNGFFELMKGLNRRCIDPSKDLSKVTLNTLIGDGEACVIVVLDSNEISLEDYPKRGFYLKSFLDIYNSYSNTDNVDKMMSDQISKMKEQRTSKDDDMFLLSWTLTQTSTQAVGCGLDFSGETQSVLDLADKANSMTSFIFKQTTKDSYPNIILTDDAARSNVLPICELIHTRLTTPDDVIFIST